MRAQTQSTSEPAHAVHDRTPVLAYLRVSTDEQGRSGLGLEDQRRAVERAADYKRWEVIDWIEETASGKDDQRPGYQRVLDLLENGGPDVLVVAKLDRLTRSMKDFAGLLERAKEHDWKLVALDLDVDMTTANGEMVANMMVTVAQWERRIIGERTKAALAQAKANGKRLGPRPNIPARVIERILAEREKGHTLQRIADGLNGDYGDEPVPTAQGGKQWYPSTVSHVLKAHAAQR